MLFCYFFLYSYQVTFIKRFLCACTADATFQSSYVDVTIINGMNYLHKALCKSLTLYNDFCNNVDVNFSCDICSRMRNELKDWIFVGMMIVMSI